MKIKHTANISDVAVEPDQLICNLYYLMQVSGLSEDEIEALVEHNLLTPIHQTETSETISQTTSSKHFSLNEVLFASCARRLKDDFELDSNGLVMALHLMRRIDRLQAELSVLRACTSQLTFFSDV